MSAPEPARPSRRREWILVAMLGALFALGIAFLLGQQSTPASLEARYAGQADLGPTLAALRQYYPAEHAALLARAAGVADARGEEAADAAILAELRTFLASKAGALANGPPDDLARLSGTIRDLMLALRQVDPERCAQFVMRGVMDRGRLPEQVTARIGAMNALMFRAARRAESGAGVRRGTAPDPADIAAWHARIRAVDPALAAQIEGGPRTPDTPARVCDRGIGLYRAAAELPQAQAANITSLLVRLSFGGA
jgi:hypothetical protein